MPIPCFAFAACNQYSHLTVGCTHVVDDTTDGPRIARRARENRRTSNPNQILGRTEIRGLKKERPKSEIVRSASLPRSSERPRINSLGYDEFVEIHDFEGFARNKSRTLPNRKKRVTYHEGTKELQSLSETEVIKIFFNKIFELSRASVFLDKVFKLDSVDVYFSAATRILF